MSETDTPQSGKPPSGDTPGNAWDWRNPQIVIGVAGIVATVIASIFGVAMAWPMGQDLLCQSMGISCRHARPTDVQLSITAIDHDGWCTRFLDDIARSDEPPPPGFDGVRADCGMDFSDSVDAAFTHRLGHSYVNPDGESIPTMETEGATAGGGTLLVAHMSMKHQALAVDTPFTLRAYCMRYDAGVAQMAPVACRLSVPAFDPPGAFASMETTVAQRGDPQPEGLPEGAQSVLMTQGSLLTVRRWRLDIDDQKTADVAPGHYTLVLSMGDPGEPVEFSGIETSFDIYPRSP